MAFLFEEIRYELAGVEVCRTKNVGITTTINKLLLINDHSVKTLSNAESVAPGQDALTVNTMEI